MSRDTHLHHHNSFKYTKMQLHRPTLERAKSSFKATAKALIAFVHQDYQPLPSDPWALQRVLDSALPAEHTWHKSDFWSAGAEESAYTCLAPQSSDGLWLCCCGRENSLIHYQGQSPFKHLKCSRCNHNLCASCSTTDILTLISPQWVDLDAERSSKASGKPVRYCSVCTGCGLSHRATFDGTHLTYHEAFCPCGKARTQSRHYLMGTVNGWRKDPSGQAITLRLDRTMAASERIRAESKRKYQEFLRDH